jgi:hypothetical protein
MLPIRYSQRFAQGALVDATEKHDYATYVWIGVAGLVSATGWLAADKWVAADSPAASVAVALMRTLFTLLPAAIAWWIASRRQRSVHQALSRQLDELKAKMAQSRRLSTIQIELDTMNRLAKVSRSAVKDTASTANALLQAIDTVVDPATKERLAERFRIHSDGLRTVLIAVNEELQESGRTIARELTAEDAIHILEREEQTNAKGIELAEKLAQQRGLHDGVRALAAASEQARQIQVTLMALPTGATAIPAIAKD